MRRPMPRLLPSVAVCSLLLSGCWNTPGGGAGMPDSGGAGGGPTGLGADPPEWDLYEPVVRHLLPATAAGAGGGRATVYVGLPDGGPAERFCRRFRGQPVPVLPLPAGREAPGGGPAAVIQISEVSGEKVQWEGADRARVFVRTYAVGEQPFCA